MRLPQASCVGSISGRLLLLGHTSLSAALLDDETAYLAQAKKLAEVHRTPKRCQARAESNIDGRKRCHKSLQLKQDMLGFVASCSASLRKASCYDVISGSLHLDSCVSPSESTSIAQAVLGNDHELHSRQGGRCCREDFLQLHITPNLILMVVSWQQPTRHRSS